VEVKDFPISRTALALLCESLAALGTVERLCFSNVAVGDEGTDAMLARCSPPARTRCAD